MPKRTIDIAVISDVHLGTFGAKAKELESYLKSIQPKILVINGDFIDGWNFKKKYFPAAHFDVIQRIVKMLSKGTKVYYVTGNHDDFLRVYSDLHLGNFHLVDQLVLNIDGQKAWFFHGDVFDVSIQGRMKYLAKIGGVAYDFLIWLNHHSNRLLQLFRLPKMSFSKRIKASVKLAVKWVSDFEEVAVDLAVKNDCAYVVCGHIHTPCIKSIKHARGGTIKYLNSGDWVENNSALEFSAGEWKIVHHFQAKSLPSILEKNYRDSKRIDVQKLLKSINSHYLNFPSTKTNSL